MSEVYFIPNPDESSPIGLLRVPIADQELAYQNPAIADLIKEAIDVTRIDDPQARIMEALYRGDDIPRKLVEHMEPTIQELGVAWPVRGRLYDLLGTDTENNTFTRNRIDGLGTALESQVRASIHYLTRDGLLASPSSTTKPSLHDATGRFIPNREARSVADRLRTETYAYQTELVWQRGDDGESHPVLLSDRHHVALGHIATDGTFEHVATVLSPNHRTRQTT